ncbi:hypothetical protein LOTGIDRAFT_172631 [Lottia gigantea]|uniref:Uncharacterized protein n=1 Tax=Lottia gigantea TaxID=225164 RepID=V4AVW2_LOTGI|nr:hypothetical protein LOTGIDRAFT_172631 [Lottia gigantea]ESP01533.1 hypothetical protein LOTGIDRAFT_172631 [Lottia gigantea]
MSFTDRHNLCSFGLMKFTNTPAAPPMPFRQNIYKKFINQIVALVIRMEHDPNFRILSLLEGAKLAIMTVSGAIAEARFDELKGLVDEKARGEIELNCSFMSDKKRRLLELCEEDTLPGTSSIYLENIRIIHQEKGNVELEASVVLSYIQNSQELLRHTESTEKPHFREVFSKVFDNIQICHYIFRKKIAKNSENSWIIQRLEHFASKHMLNH